jgi:ferrous iron transport protein B
MKRKVTVALVGNPNAGKTTIFNALTGARQHVGNWPGVTVEKKEGTVRYEDREVHVVDLPGAYSLTAFSLEEIIARNFILDGSADVVIDVVDAANLERNLYLTVQLLEMGVKLVVALNMIDVAAGRNIEINHEKLSKLLGAPVIPMDGKRRIGVEELLAAAVSCADEGRAPTRPDAILYGSEVEEELDKLRAAPAWSGVDAGGRPRRWIAVKLLEGDPDVTESVKRSPGGDSIIQLAEASRNHLAAIFDDPPEIVLADARYGVIAGALRQTVRLESSDRVHLSETIDKALTHRLLGPLILVGVLYGVYVFTFQGSDPLVKLCEAGFNRIAVLVSQTAPEGLLRSVIVSGVIDGVGGVLRFVPLIAFMFFAIAILEDTGYMARIAFMLDRALRGFGLHGASMLALMVAGGIAGGCAVPGIMATRTLREPKERLTTILVVPLMNCGAKLPVYALLIGAFFPGHKAGMMMLLTAISWTMVLLMGRLIRTAVLSGPSAPFVLELPPYRTPTLRGLLIHTWERTWMYIKKAATVILVISILLWALMTFPQLPQDRRERFDSLIAQSTRELLESPAADAVFTSEADIKAFKEYRELPAGRERERIAKERPGFRALSRALKELDKLKESGDSERFTASDSLAAAYERYSESVRAIEREKQTEHLRNTVGGRVGIALERLTWPMNFDWRVNIALIGGFAAKEVVVATLGTAYSLGESAAEDTTSFAERLRNEPHWNALTAFTLIIFVMLYAPCFVTLVVMTRETGTLRWPLFALVYTTTLAYCAAVAVYQVGSFLGIGV